MTKAGTTLISVPDTQELAIERDKYVTLAESLAIDTPADYTGAGAMFKALKNMEDRVHEKTDEPVSLAHKTHKAIKELQNDLLKPIETARKLVKKKMGDYDLEQERIRRAEEDRVGEQQHRGARETPCRGVVGAGRRVELGEVHEVGADGVHLDPGRGDLLRLSHQPNNGIDLFQRNPQGGGKGGKRIC